MNAKIQSFIDNIPEVADAAALRETFWLNPKRQRGAECGGAVTLADMDDAAARLQRFAPYLAEVFPELRDTQGEIESELHAVPKMQRWLREQYGTDTAGSLWLKMDGDLPVSGSVKARGGIYEVLKHAEDLALASGSLKIGDDYRVLAEPQWRAFFGRYRVQVGSTGNLGLSIGIMSARLGFRATVHMSADAKQWKKDLLRSRGAEVVEYAGDYGAAVAQGRRQSDADPHSYFVDDEHSKNLFLGYSVAGRRLQRQLAQQGVAVDENHPLFVYLPCGIGGAPGGIAYGLHAAFGDAVHCFFAEPTHACCMLLGMATGLQDAVCVQDFGIDGRTEADGLAVGRPSAFVGRLIEPILAGVATMDDAKLYALMRGLMETENLFVEPSACAAFANLLQGKTLARYIETAGLASKMAQATHIVWATGGSMVPQSVRQEYWSKCR